MRKLLILECIVETSHSLYMSLCIFDGEMTYIMPKSQRTHTNALLFIVVRKNRRVEERSEGGRLVLILVAKRWPQLDYCGGTRGLLIIVHQRLFHSACDLSEGKEHRPGSLL